MQFVNDCRSPTSCSFVRNHKAGYEALKEGQIVALFRKRKAVLDDTEPGLEGDDVETSNSGADTNEDARFMEVCVRVCTFVYTLACACMLACTLMFFCICLYLCAMSWVV